MIVTNKEHFIKYDYLSEKFKIAYDFLKRDDLESLPVGKIKLKGDEVIADIQEYKTSSRNDLKFETHKDNIDIHYMVKGTESIEVCDSKFLIPEGEYDCKNDIRFFKEPKEKHSQITLTIGDIAVLLIEDGHKPRCSVNDKSQSVKKIVIKVKI